MKTNGFKCLDGVVDSMAGASASLGVSIETVKSAKRKGCEAFRGSRVHLGKLRKWLADEQEPGGVYVLLLVVVDYVAQRVPEALARCRRKRFVADSDKICQAVHNGFALALCIVEPDLA